MMMGIAGASVVSPFLQCIVYQVPVLRDEIERRLFRESLDLI